MDRCPRCGLPRENNDYHFCEAEPQLAIKVDFLKLKKLIKKLKDKKWKIF